MNLQELPHPPAASLHILPPWLPWALFLTLLLGLLILYGLWRFRRTPGPSNTAAAPSTSPTRNRDPFTLVINRIEAEFLASQAYRSGLHALATAIRTRLEAVKSINAEEMTVAEISIEIDDHKINTLMEDLRAKQFGKRPPGKKNFKNMCSRAIEAFAKKSKRVS